MGLRKFLIIGAIIICGLWARAWTFQLAHPDTDELFELQNMQSIMPAAVLKNNIMYGDHTSFPGEYLVHFYPMQALNLFSTHAVIDIANHKLQGISKAGFWLLAAPKIVLTLLSVWLFYLICAESLKTLLGFIVAFSLLMFNGDMIYHAFSLRPYGILPELAIFNLYLASRENKERWFYIVHGAALFFTCIYHAYGPMIAGLPLLFFPRERFKSMLWFVVPSLFAWTYYASYSTFGLVPNAVQSKYDPFYIIPAPELSNVLAARIFGSNVFTAATVVPVIIGLGFIGKWPWKFLGVLILLPMALIMLVDIKTSYIIHFRQMTWIMPAIALWCAIVTESSFGGRNEEKTNVS